MKNYKKKIIVIIISLLLITVVAPMMVTIIIYEKNFGVRYETRGWWLNDIEDFQGLKRDEVALSSNKGQKLAAYTYYNEDTKVPKGVIVLAHGLGAGHNAYMPQIDYLTRNDYVVFTYDVTGNDNSEGDSIEGIPQAVVDLDNVLSFVEEREEFKGYPILLYGHSWGGYAVTSVLNYDHNIMAVVEMSGFNSSIDIIKEKGKSLYGNLINVIVPYIEIYEWFKFGDVASVNAIDGLSKTSAKVLLIHGTKDGTVSYTNNFKRYMNVLGDKNNLSFEAVDDYGHQIAFNLEYNKTVSKYKKEAISVYGDINSIPEDIQEELIDKVKNLPDKLNTERMDQVVNFYNDVINQDYQY